MKVSIITCTYNSDKYLEECINSVQTQTYPYIEHIIVDGNSTDTTHEILRRHGLKFHPREPRGISDAMNYGIDLAEGNLIAHLHSDDYYCDNTIIDYIVNKLSSSECKWSYGKMMSLLADSKRRIFDPQKARFRNLFWQSYIMHQTVFIQKEIFNDVGQFNIDLKYAMDLDLWFRIISKYEPIYIEKVVACFRKHHSSTTSMHQSKSQREALMVALSYCKFNPLMTFITLAGFFKRNIFDRFRKVYK